MPGRLQAELKQGRPFSGAAEEALLSIVRTADAIQRDVAEALKPVGLTPTQYNVLRILRGAGEAGRTCGEVGERMVTRDPDVTRMLDRLFARGLIARERSSDDRRVVRTRITTQGLRLLEEAEGPIRTSRERQFGRIGKERLQVLIETLAAVRAGET